MEVFDGKKAAQDYMSKHTLAFSTPELTLMRFAFWLGDTVPDPKNKENTLPRMLTFMTEQDFAPVLIDEETYVPSGAVKNSSKIYGNPQPRKYIRRQSFVRNVVQNYHLLQSFVLNVELHKNKPKKKKN